MLSHWPPPIHHPCACSPGPRVAHGSPMGRQWIIHESLTGSSAGPRVAHGSPMSLWYWSAGRVLHESAALRHGSRTGRPWAETAGPWVAHASLIGGSWMYYTNTWVAHESLKDRAPVIAPAHGSPMDRPWVAHRLEMGGPPIDHPRVSYGLHVLVHGSPMGHS